MPGFLVANPSALYQPIILDPIYHYQAVNVEAQLASPTSLLNWVRRLIKVRREHKVFSRGSLEFIPCHNRHVVAYVRAYQDQAALVVNNLSRFSQPVELDLSRYKGMALTEIGGNVPFPDDRRAAVPDHPGAARLLLVPAGDARLRERSIDEITSGQYQDLAFVGRARPVASRLGWPTSDASHAKNSRTSSGLSSRYFAAVGSCDGSTQIVIASSKATKASLVGHVVAHHDRQSPVPPSCSRIQTTAFPLSQSTRGRISWTIFPSLISIFGSSAAMNVSEHCLEVDLSRNVPPGDSGSKRSSLSTRSRLPRARPRAPRSAR